MYTPNYTECFEGRDEKTGAPASLPQQPTADARPTAPPVASIAPLAPIAPIAALLAGWRAVSVSEGVVLLDISIFDGLSDLAQYAEWQLLPLEELHALLGHILKSRHPQTDAELQPPAASPADLSTLTPRQQDVVREVARGASNAEIAAALHIGVETVKTHIRQILARLDVRNRTEIAAMYQRAVEPQKQVS